MSLVSIRNLLNTHIGIQKNSNFLYHSQLTSGWPSLVGSQISNNTTVVSVKDGVVKIAVTSATWATELSAIKQDLILRINTTLEPSKGSVRDIVFYVDNKDPQIDDQTPEATRNRDVLKKVPLDDQERSAVEESVSCIKNEHLRDLAIKVTTSDLETKKGISGIG